MSDTDKLILFPGDMVMLNSGGPPMIAERVTAEGELICWWASAGAMCQAPFKRECLTLLHAAPVTVGL